MWWLCDPFKDHHGNLLKALLECEKSRSIEYALEDLHAKLSESLPCYICCMRQFQVLLQYLFGCEHKQYKCQDGMVDLFVEV